METIKQNFLKAAMWEETRWLEILKSEHATNHKLFKTLNINNKHQSAENGKLNLVEKKSLKIFCYLWQVWWRRISPLARQSWANLKVCWQLWPLYSSEVIQVWHQNFIGGGAESNKNRVFVRDRDFISWSLNDEIRPRLVFLWVSISRWDRCFCS